MSEVFRVMTVCVNGCITVVRLIMVFDNCISANYCVLQEGIRAENYKANNSLEFFKTIFHLLNGYCNPVICDLK